MRCQRQSLLPPSPFVKALLQEKRAVHIGCKAAQPEHYRRPAQRSTSYLSSRPPFFSRERLLAAPAKFETEIKRRVPHGVARTRLSLVPHEIQIRPVCADFGQTPQRISDIKD